MSNPYYNISGAPVTSSPGASAVVRSEFAAIAAGFALLPTLAGNAGQAVVVNGSGTALTTAPPTGITTTGAFTTVFAQQANTTLTLPATSQTLATLAGVETLTNKTLTAPSVVGGTITSGTLSGATLTGTTTLSGSLTASGQTITGGTFSGVTLAGTTTVTGPVTMSGQTVTGGTYSGITLATPTFSGTTTLASGATFDASNTLQQNQNATTVFAVRNTNGGSSAFAEVSLDNGTSTAAISVGGAGVGTTFPNVANAGSFMGGGANGLILNTTVSAPIRFGINSVEKLRFDTSGRLLAGYAADQGGGQLLQVNSGALINGAAQFTGANGVVFSGSTQDSVTGTGTPGGGLVLNAASSPAVTVKSSGTNVVVGGLEVGSPTGGMPGTGVVNATGYQINGAALAFTKTPFVSGQQTITAAGALTLAHGLGVKPTLVMVKLHCVTAEHGYNIGDEQFVFANNGNLSTAWTHSIVPDATNLNVRFGSANPTYQGIDQSSGSGVGLTNANWTAIFMAWA